MWEYNHINELCHYGVPGMRWGVRRAEKLQKKARQYAKYAKQFKKEGSRRYGSDGARQTDSEIKWMNQLAEDNKRKSQKYEAKAQRLLDKIKSKSEAKQLKADVKEYSKLRSEFGSSIMKSVERKSTEQDKHANTQKLLKVKDFVDKKSASRGRDYAARIIQQADKQQMAKNRAVGLLFIGSLAGAAGVAYLESKFE